VSDTSPREPLTAIGYVRVSTMREEKISPELQRTAIASKAARDGVTIGEWIEELDISGRGFGRRGVQRAIGLVEAGQASAIYVWKFSRFGRNVKGVVLNNARIEEAGGRLVSATEDVDAGTAVGRLSRGVIWHLDEFQSDIIGEQWKETHARRRASGLPHQGQPRFGYVYHRATAGERVCPQGCKPGRCTTGYMPDVETAREVAWMYAAYNTGTSVLKIAVDLNSRGLRAPGRGQYAGGGHVWDQRGVRRFMDSGFAVGLLRVHDPGCGCGNAQGCARKVYEQGVASLEVSRAATASGPRMRACWPICRIRLRQK